MHSPVIRWLIDWLSTRTCLKVCAPRFCLKVCALPCYAMVDWLIEYEDMPQSLRTPFLPQSLCTPLLCDGWLIDWVRGHASKSAHPVFASKSVHSPVMRWLIDWLSTRTCLKVCAPWKLIIPGNKPTKVGQLQPSYGHSNRASYKTRRKTESEMVSYKKRKKYQQRLLNQSINHWIRWECAHFEANPPALYKCWKAAEHPVRISRFLLFKR